MSNKPSYFCARPQTNLRRLASAAALLLALLDLGDLLAQTESVVEFTKAAGALLGPQSEAELLIADDEGPGSVDPDFETDPGPNDSVTAVARQSDGRIVIGGFFTDVRGTPRNRIARLEADGSLDLTFDPGTGADYFIQRIILYPEGGIVIGGAFTNFNGTAAGRIARLNSDGSIDPAFRGGTGANDWVDALAIAPGGRILVGGRFTEFDGQPRRRMARLDAFGSLDPEFQPVLDGNTVAAIVPLPSGHILIGGDFQTVNGIARERVARLHADGSLDETFQAPAELGRMIAAIAVQADDRIIVGGDFVRLGSVTRRFIARLHPDGSLDEFFAPSFDDKVDSLALQRDGKILAGGAFTLVDNQLRGGIARLNADGTLDLQFDPGQGANNRVLSVLIQPDRRILAAGRFTFMDTFPRQRIARLYGDDLELVFEPPARSPEGNFTLRARVSTGERTALEASTNLLEWTALSTNLSETGLIEWPEEDPVRSRQRFYRLRLE